MSLPPNSSLSPSGLPRRRRLSDLSVAVKVMSALGIAILATALVGGVAVATTSSMARTTERMYTEQVLGTSLAGQMRFQMLSVRVNALSAAYVPDKSATAGFITARDAALAGALARPAIAQQQSTVTWWYHFDNPEASPKDLIAKFEAANPSIKINAQSIPWGGGNDYYTRLFAGLIAGSGPDCAMVKLNNQARLLDLKALAPIDDMVASWDARGDISDNIWKLNKASDGKQYYLPLQYVVIYLYYRTDMFKVAGIEPPKTFDEFRAAAKAVTKDGVFGFGMRGGAGGYDNWGPFVLGAGASFAKGGMVTPEAIKALHKLGFRVVMATGDNERTAKAVAARLGIDEIRADVLPQDKARIIQELQAQGCKVAMAGDGVNDAPALAQADVGIAMGTGADVAIESAGITLLRGDLSGIARARHLSRGVMRNIRQNLFFAFIYNVLGIPIAAGVLYPAFGLLLSPMIASAAMSLSSVSVIANALRLRRLRL